MLIVFSLNNSLCPFYHVLWWKSKVLLNMGKINRLMVPNRTVRVKISEISASISITHADDITKFSLILIYLSVHSLVKAFNLSFWVILQIIDFFSFNFLLSCFRVFNIFGAFISIIIIIFLKVNFFLKKNQLSFCLEN